MSVKKKKSTVRPPVDAYDLFGLMSALLEQPDKPDLSTANLWVVALDKGESILNLELCGMGNYATVVHEPADILSIPLQKKAFGIVLIHNVPTGDLTPSESDIDFTDHVSRIGEIVNIEVIDHLILGGYRGKTNHYFSLKDHHIMEGLKYSTKYLLKPEAETLLMKQITQLHNIIELQQENNKFMFKEGKLEGMQIGLEKGKIEEKLEIAKAMIQEGEPIDKITRFTGLSIQQLEQLIRAN